MSVTDEITCRYTGKARHECWPAEGLCRSEEQAREFDPHPSPGARGLGVVALIGPGWFVHSREKNAELDGMTNGLVLEVINTTNPDTGETERGFELLCWPHGRMRFRHLDEAHVDPTECAPAEPHSLREHIRRLATEFHRSTSKRGAFDTDVYLAGAAIHRLLAVLEGRR